MLSGILFDFDGTLADSLPISIRSYDATLQKFGFHLTSKEIQMTCLGRTEDAICKALNIEDKTETFRNEYFHISSLLSSSVELFPKVIQTLQYAKKQNIKLGIITFAHRFYIEKMLKKLYISDYFDSVISFDDVKFPKPNPEAVYLSCITLGLKKEDTVIIGDSPDDIAMGKAAKITTTLFLPRDNIQIYSNNVFTKVNPDYTVKNYNELLLKLKDLMLNNRI